MNLGIHFFFCIVLFWDEFPGMELFDKGMQGKGTFRVWEARLVIEGELKRVRKGEVCLPHSCQSGQRWRRVRCWLGSRSSDCYSLPSSPDASLTLALPRRRLAKVAASIPALSLEGAKGVTQLRRALSLISPARTWLSSDCPTWSIYHRLIFISVTREGCHLQLMVRGPKAL